MPTLSHMRLQHSYDDCPNIYVEGDTAVICFVYPIGSMYAIFTYVNTQNQVNVGNYSMHGSYGCSNVHYILLQYTLNNLACSTQKDCIS